MLKQIAIYSRYFFYVRYRNITTLIMHTISPVLFMLIVNNEGSLNVYIQFITYLSSVTALSGVLEFLVIRKEKYLIQYHTIVKSPMVFLFSKMNIELLILFQIQVLYFIFMNFVNNHNHITFYNWLLTLVSSVIIVNIFTFYLLILTTLDIGESKIDSIRTFGSIILFILAFIGKGTPKILMQLNPIIQTKNFVYQTVTKLQFDINIYMIIFIVIGAIIFIYSVNNIKIYVKE